MIWQKRFPEDEKYGFTSQIKRAAISIPGNIAEGAARQTRKEFIQFLYIARGSISELDAYLEIAQRLGYIMKDAVAQIDEKMIDLDKMLTGLIYSLKEKG